MKKIKEAYRSCKADAKRRGILFLLTFDEWFTVWEASGHLHERGPRVGQYVMARFGDVGPYTVENVRITTSSENHAEYNYGRGISPMKGKRIKESTKIKIANTKRGRPSALKGIRRSDEFRAKIKASKQNISAETRAKMSAWQKGKSKAEVRRSA